MCGIAGFIDPESSPDIRRGAVEKMCQAMLHRGPDDSGVESMGPATLGMRRLAIFDPANGHQPMQSPDGRYTIVFNGAIYNFQKLRDELGGSHWSFRTHCDTEVLLAAYAHWGQSCLKRLRGMFAFAVWDQREQTLFFARDPLGIKPLYFRQEGPRLLFASEINALLASATFSTSIDPAAVEDYLGWFAVPAPRTIYRDITTLRPGESALLRQGRLERRTDWSFRKPPESAAPCQTREEFIRQLRGQLEDSVRAHVVADVPVGAFLSGGMDSAAVVALMSRVGGARLRTFSIDFAEPGYSEASEAAATAQFLGTEHRTSVVTGAEITGDVEKLFATFDQPTGDGLNTYYASQAARAGGVTVALSGLGGDELFGGYPSFRDTPRLARWLRPWRAVPGRVRAGIVSRLQRGDTRRRKLADVLHYARSIHEIGALQRRVYSVQAGRALLAPDVAAALGPRSPFHPELESLAADLDENDAFDLVSSWELRTYMADVLLRDSDVMSMRHSLELRVPLVDRTLVEWLRQQPSRFKTDSKHPKSALAESLRDLLPPEVVARRKRGFTVPFAIWMKRELRPFLDEMFSDSSIGRSGLLDIRATQQAWSGFLAGDDTREWSRVWSLAVLIGFANRPRTTPPLGRFQPTPEIRSPGSAQTVAAPAPSRVGAVDSSELRAERPISGTDEPSDRTTNEGHHFVPHSALGSQRSAESVWPKAYQSGAKMRPLLLAPEFFASEGGIARILQSYLKALCDLNESGAPTRLLALNDANLDPKRLEKLTGKHLPEWSACGRSKVRLLREALRLSRDSTDLICGHVFMLPAAWLAKKRNPRLRYHLVAHGIEVWRSFSLAERIALRGATRILCVSDYTRRELLKNCPLPEGRAVVLHNSLDPSFTIALGRPLTQCPPTILSVTRLTYADRYKGVQHLIEAMPAIREQLPAARLRLVGRGDDVPRLQRIAQQLGLSDAVDFVGYIDDTRLKEELQTCRLFALPSRKEGFGLVFLEAMANGRPCLGAKAGGIPEVITQETGVLTDYGDVPQLARTCLDGLQRNWDQDAILARARHFAYPLFRQRLADILQQFQSADSRSRK